MIKSLLRLKTEHQGFTLIELLVVIAIIGLLASTVLASVSNARILARDASRKTHLKQVQTALELYYNKNGTYQVANSGYLGAGNGWLSYENVTDGYSTSVTRALYNASLLGSRVLEDPLQRPGFMIYICNSGNSYSISATLEKPSAADIAFIQTTCNGVGGNGTYTAYGKNYALTNP